MDESTDAILKDSGHQLLCQVLWQMLSYGHVPVQCVFVHMPHVRINTNSVL